MSRCLRRSTILFKFPIISLGTVAPPLDWKRCSSSQSSPFSVIRIISTEFFCGLWVFSPTRHLVRDLIELFLFAACSVAILLVHANANLFLSRKINQIRMLARLSLDIPAIFATGDTLYFVSAVLRTSSIVFRVPRFKKNWSIPTRAAVSPHETTVICSVVRLIINTVR